MTKKSNAKKPSPDVPKSPSESRIEMREIVFPNDANNHGTIFGGKVLQLMDIACAMSAQKHCRGPVVTAAMDQVEFLSAIPLGHHIVLNAMVNYVSNSSLEVGVRVSSEDPYSGHETKTSSAYLIFVHLDKDGKPTPAPELLPQTDGEKQRYEEARERMEIRRARRRRE